MDDAWVLESILKGVGKDAVYEHEGSRVNLKAELARQDPRALGRFGEEGAPFPYEHYAEVLASDLPNGADQGDLLIVEGQTWTVEYLDEDLHGGVRLILSG